MKIYPYHTPEGVIDLVEKREYDKLREELDSITNGEIITNVRLFNLVRYARAILHAADLITDSEYVWLCSRNQGEPSQLRAANYELIERMAEARKSHHS